MSANAYKDFIKPFTGEGDVVSFITKVELVAGLKKIDEAKFLPLYLEGHALAIYLEMGETDRKTPRFSRSTAITTHSRMKHRREKTTVFLFRNNSYFKIAYYSMEGVKIDILILR